MTKEIKRQYAQMISNNNEKKPTTMKNNKLKKKSGRNKTKNIK